MEALHPFCLTRSWLSKLHLLDLPVIDDRRYLPQDGEESEVLFILIAERYERRSPGINSTWSSHGSRRCSPTLRPLLPD